MKADIGDKQALAHALQGAHSVFAMTTGAQGASTKEQEIDQGKALADTAVANGAKYFIWSTLSSTIKISEGKYKNNVHFDSKAEVEEYIRTLPIKSAFFAPGSFMSNFHVFMAPRPSHTGDGTYAISNIVRSDTLWPLIDTVGDTGKFVGAILAEPEKYEGKVFSAATRMYTMGEICADLSKSTGKTVKYNELPRDVFAGFLPPGSADEYCVSGFSTRLSSPN